MSNITLDKNTIQHFAAQWTKKVKVFLYEAGCSGNKVDITDDFEVSDELTPVLSDEDIPSIGFQIYLDTKDVDKFDGAMITRVVKADHTGQEQVRYIFSQNDVLDRCGCGTSFSFEKKKINIDLNKLKDLKARFGK